MFEKVKETLAQKIVSYLKLYPSQGNNFIINELLDLESNIALDKIWYRGDAYELEQLYKQLNNNESHSFWGTVPSAGLEIRKIHTGIPKIMVDILAGLVVDDMQGVEFDSEADKSLWGEIAKENNFKDIVEEAITKTLYEGDGAFKISIDTDLSQYPIIEFVDADKIEVVRRKKRVHEIIFKSVIDEKGKGKYYLHEIYGRGYINYELYNESNKEVSLNSTEATSKLAPITWDGNFALCEYIRFYKSDKFEDRGRSIYDAKRDNFDALDEAFSQWMDALRAGRTKTYIPENLIPRDGHGNLMRPSTFDNRFIGLAASISETDNGKIEVVSPDIPSDDYLQTYITALDLCLQGIISPSTLGIDTKKLDNAEAQREKEKATLYTRQKIVNVLQMVLPSLVLKVMKSNQTLHFEPIKDIDVNVPFGEYANPSFESQVETVGKAKSNGIMSVEASIDELYGDSKDAEWKKEEAKRIKAELGIAEVDEPALANNIDMI